jgi:hypothetical protein
MTLRFNANDKVRVRLTDEGRRIHRAKHFSLFANWKEPPPYSAPTEDADGWSEWQMHDLMQQFGSSMVIGCRVPFETEIELLMPVNEQDQRR